MEVGTMHAQVIVTSLTGITKNETESLSCVILLPNDTDWLLDHVRFCLEENCSVSIFPTVLGEKSPTITEKWKREHKSQSEVSAIVLDYNPFATSCSLFYLHTDRDIDHLKAKIQRTIGYEASLHFYPLNLL